MTRALSVAILLVLASPASARGGIDATIEDSFGFKMRLSDLVFRIKPKPGSGNLPERLDHIPLDNEAEGRVNLWLSQIDTATFSPQGRTCDVKATLQGDGKTAQGTVADAANCYFEGKVANGPRKGAKAKFPIRDVKTLQSHSEHQAVVSAVGTLLPMPKPTEDVLYVSSVPTGAEVYAKAYKGAAAETWREYRSLGRAPLKQKVPPGTYAIKVTVPDVLAKHMQPSTKLGADQHPFLNDYAQPEFYTNNNVLHAVIYSVEKEPGRAATLIALFQPKGLSVKEALTIYPKGNNFQFLEKKLVEQLGYQRVPEAAHESILEALRRGGKVIWVGRKKALRFWAVPRAPGYKWGGADVVVRDVKDAPPTPQPKRLNKPGSKKQTTPGKPKGSVLKTLRGE
jgi:hypothetical protein